MPLGTDNSTITTMDALIPEVWSSRVNNFFRANLKAAAFFEDWSSELAGGGDVVHVPNITEMTAAAKAANTQVVLTALTEDTINLTVNVHTHVAFLIEDAAASKVKASYMLQEKYAKNAGYTVASKLEDALIALFSGFSQTVGTSAIGFNDSNVRQAIAYLDAANIPAEDRAFFLHPTTVWTQLQGIDRFSLVVNTAGADPLLKGQLTTMYGIPVVGSSRIPVVLGSRYGALAHSSALAFATGNMTPGQEGSIRLQTDYRLEYLGTLVVADLMYGVIENRDLAGVLIKALS